MSIDTLKIESYDDIELSATVRAAGESGEHFCLALYDLVSDLKALKVVAMDVREIVSYTDFITVIEANSTTHMMAMGNRIISQLKKLKIRPVRVDGWRSTQWLAIDYGSILVHIMTPEAYSRYDLERLWGDAPRMSLPS